MTRDEAVHFLTTEPYKLGHVLGFTKLTELNNEWIVDMVTGQKDATLQAHRESYKTTCVSVALSIIAILLPNVRTLFMRKTDDDVKEIIAQVRKILLSPQMCIFSNTIYGVDLRLMLSNAGELTTNLTTDPRGTSQLVAMGAGGSLTGKHFDRIFTDDIVNMQDRVSKAERERTKLIYQELQNIRNRGSRIFNTGTPWHKDDAFSLMPNIQRYDCYSTGLMTPSQIQAKKGAMTASLFAANYELRHIAEEDVIFLDAQYADDVELACDGYSHVDAAYGGADGTAFTACKKRNGKYYVYGKLWQKHVDNCVDDILLLTRQLRSSKIYNEDNGDKGYLSKELRERGGRPQRYHEDMNKFLKITSYLKAAWKDVYFVPGTDPDYIQQILDYNENAEHDDAPDSLASLIRKQYFRRGESGESKSVYGGVL